MGSYVRWSGVYSRVKMNVDISSRKVGDYCYNEESGEILVGLENFPKLRSAYDNDNEISIDWDLNEGFNPEDPLLSDPGDNVEETLRFLLKHAEDLGTTKLAVVVDNSKVVCNRNFIGTLVNVKKWQYFFEQFNGILFVKKNNSFKQVNLKNEGKRTLYLGLEFENRLFEKDAYCNWKSKSAVITKFPTIDGLGLKVLYTNQIDGVDSKNATIEAKSGQKTNKNIILTQCKLGMVETALFGNCDNGIVTKLRKEKVDDLVVDEKNANNFIFYFVRKMNSILEQSSQLSENQILVASCNNGEITYNIVDKTENNEVLSQEDCVAELLFKNPYPPKYFKCDGGLCNDPKNDFNTSTENFQCYESNNESLGELKTCPKNVNACAVRFEDLIDLKVANRSCAKPQDKDKANDVYLCMHSGCNNFTKRRECYYGSTDTCSNFKKLVPTEFSSETPIKENCNRIMSPNVCTTTIMKMKVNDEEIICKLYGCYHIKVDYHLTFKKDPKLEQFINKTEINGNPVDIIVKQCIGDLCNEYETRRTDTIKCYVGKGSDGCDNSRYSKNPIKRPETCNGANYCLTEIYHDTSCIFYDCLFKSKEDYIPEGFDYFNDTETNAEYFRCNTSLCNTEKEESGIIGELSHATMPKMMFLMICISFS
uniref:Uncharacterized protein n=1 Tax=Panagrolaimus sp. JU765 TaxID=591449 RepID=A0AC34Q8P5_9BILA